MPEKILLPIENVVPDQKNGLTEVASIQPDSEVIRSTVIIVDQGEMNVTGQQFAEWYLRKFPQ
jgi:hypothetical protein